MILSKSCKFLQDLVEILTRSWQDFERSWQGLDKIVVKSWQDVMEIFTRSWQDIERSWQDLDKSVL